MTDTACGMRKTDFCQRSSTAKIRSTLAGINKNLLILVGPRTIRAIDSFSGSESWKVQLGVDDLPSGRGYIGDDSLFVPTTSRKILRIDLVKGEVAESVGTSRVLGNLSRVKGDVVSHGVDHVASYPEYGASKKKIESLPAGELDEEQQFIKLQTLIQQGDIEPGLDMLISLASKNKDSRYSVLLKSCATNFQTEYPALSLKALDALKKFYPEVDVKSLERLRMLSKLRTGEYRESAELGLDQLEESFAEFCSSESKDTSNNIVKGVSASLLDRRDDAKPDPEEIKGVEEIEFDNRYDKIQYSEFGWQRTRLQMAFDGLQDQDELGEMETRVAKLVSDSIELPKNQFQWLLNRLPMIALDDASLEIVAKHFLGKNEFLASLIYANAAIDRGGENIERFKLLKSEIMFEGRDFYAALVAIAEIDSDKLGDAEVSRIEELRKLIAEAKESASSNIRSAANWHSNDAANAKVGVSISSKEKKPKKIRYRIPFEFGATTDPYYHSLRLFACPWGDKENEFELRNHRGNLVRNMRIRDEKSTGSFGYSRKGDIDIHNHVAEIKVSKITLYVDWFKVLAGENGNLWKLPNNSVSVSRTAFSGIRETVVGVGKRLYCYETLTGKLLWKRTMEHSLTRVVSHGSRLTTWSETGRQFNTIEAATGKLVRSATSKRYVVSRAMGDYFVLEHPIRKGELSAEEEKALTGPDGPKNAANIARRFAVFKASSGRILWTSVHNPKSLQFFRNFELCMLDPDGKLSCVDLKNGNVTSAVDLPLTDVVKRSLVSFDLRRQSAGWVLHLRCKDRDDRFSRGSTTYHYLKLNSRLGTGPVYLLDDAKEKLVWKSPAYVERLEYLRDQPYDSPVIIFGRHIERVHPLKGAKHHMETVCLDCETGELVAHHLMNTLDSYDGHAIEWKQSKPSSPFDTLVISTAVESQTVKFSQDAERPPLPRTHITFNAIDFFKDPIFAESKSEVVDVRVEEFRARAAEADKRRTEKQSEAAADLKKRMQVGETK